MAFFFFLSQQWTQTDFRLFLSSRDQMVTTEKGHKRTFKGQARGRKLAFNPCCHRNNWWFWRSGDRDQRWQSLRHVRSWSRDIFNTYTRVFGPYTYFLFTSNKGHLNATVSTNSKSNTKSIKLITFLWGLMLCKERGRCFVLPLYLHIHVSISTSLLKQHIGANTSNSSFSVQCVAPFQ